MSILAFACHSAAGVLVKNAETKACTLINSELSNRQQLLKDTGAGVRTPIQNMMRLALV